MKKNIIGIIAFAAVAIVVVPFFANAANTWFVSTTGNNSNDCQSAATACLTIQGAVDKASNGDTINVEAGTYAEHVNVTKDLTINGANAGTAGNSSRAAESIVDGTDTGAPFSINANGVTIDGFTIENGSGGGLDSGIWSVTGTTNSNISNNIITDNDFGIWAQCGGNCLIENNLFDGNNKPGAGSGSASISADSTNGLTINSNEFKNDTAGNPILLQATAAGAHKDIVVTDNNFHGNTNSNIYALGITGGTFTGNTISPASDATGISFSGADTNITVTNNTITGGARGVRIEDGGYNLGTNANITVNNNSLASDSGYGVGNTGGYTGNVDATCNWWGAADGPSTVGTGSGSPVTTNVTFSPWLSTSSLDGTCNGGVTTGVKVHIVKFIDGTLATAVTAGGVQFPMVSTWTAANLNGGAETSGNYTLGTNFGGAADLYGADTASMDSGASYTTSEVTDGSVVVPTDSQSCPDGKFRLLGYKTGSTLSAAENATLSTTAPALTNITSDQYIIVENAPCTQVPPTTDTIVATKVVCDSEADLPNMSGGADITATTATDYVANHPNCHLAPDWQFQIRYWGPSDNPDLQFTPNAPYPGGSFVGEADAPWTTISGTTNANGVLTTTFDPNNVWHFFAREVLKDGYVPFSDGSDVSAEMYCGSDVLNYDNLERVDGPFTAGQTFYCVAFNAPKPTVQTSGKVHIFKFIGDGKTGAQATANNTGSASFPMFTSTFNAPFTLGPNGWTTGDVAYEASTNVMDAGASYTANEDLTTNLVGASCNPDDSSNPQYKLVGYSTGATLEQAQNATVSLTAPNVTINGDQYIIVWNENCTPTYQVHVLKYLRSGEVDTQIADNAGLGLFQASSTSRASNLNGGLQQTTNFALGNNAGGATLQYAADSAAMASGADYIVTETTGGSTNVVATNSESCPAGDYRLLGYKVGASLSAAESATLETSAHQFTGINSDQYVIVVNTPCPNGEGNGPAADLSLDKVVSDTGVTHNEKVTYTLTVTNHGPDTATNVEVNDDLPSGVSFVSSDPSVGTYDANTGIWNIGTLTNGQTVTLAIEVNVDADSGTIVNDANVFLNNTADIDGNSANDSDSAEMRVSGGGGGSSGGSRAPIITPTTTPQGQVLGAQTTNPIVLQQQPVGQVLGASVGLPFTGRGDSLVYILLLSLSVIVFGSLYMAHSKHPSIDAE